MKKLVIFIVMSFAGIIACNDNSKTVSFKRTDFHRTVSLTGTKIAFDTLLNPMSYAVIRDSFLFVTNWDGYPFFIEVYKLGSKRLVTKIAKKGRGPNEFLSCSLICRDPEDDFFLVRDIIKQTVTKYNIDSVIMKGENYKPRQISLPRYTKDVAFLDSKNLIGYNFYYLKSEKISNDVTPIFKIRAGKQLNERIDSTKMKFFTANVSGADILVSPLNDYIWCVNHYEDKIDVFNKELLFIKSMVGPDGIKPLYISNDDNRISFKHAYYRAYYSGVYTKKAVYLLYLGVNGIPNNLPFEKPVEVFKFNWSGKLLANYKLDKYIYDITIDKNEKYLYGTSSTSGGHATLFRYKLAKN
ncbi:BF3164 family lipoprotein [Pelobium manganitolerans]|uniref:BF3164 family lipoprotein n=1 Tax=Pelobium manganitolerans TaxID=1842495 RepID=UPI003FA3D4F4